MNNPITYFGLVLAFGANFVDTFDDVDCWEITSVPDEIQAKLDFIPDQMAVNVSTGVVKYGNYSESVTGVEQNIQFKAQLA